MKSYIKYLVIMFFITNCYAALDTDQQIEIQKLLQMDLATLMNIDVVSVSKKSQTLLTSAAAVHVITPHDIRHSGARSIAELLRMVPGVQVAQINASAYAVSVRGFNSSFADKLLVMIDGRTVYQPEFSGVYWETVDMPLDDIERIEVIRGPGGTLWGANAVNGVINIMTKNSKDTQGFALVAGAGDEHEGFSTLRYGGQLGEELNYRIYAKWLKRDDTPFQNEYIPVYDQWDKKQFGFRFDTELEHNKFIFEGNAYDITVGQDQWDLFVAKIVTKNAHVLTRWEHSFSETSKLDIQTYYDYNKRDDQSLFTLVNHTFDIEIQHQFQADKHHFLYGFGYRRIQADTPFTTYFQYVPTELTGNLYNLFIQDEYDLTDKVKLIAGSKFEKHYYTGWAVQPNLRISWLPTDHYTLWAAVSRAVRTPSRFQRDTFTERGATPTEAETYAPYDYAVKRAYNKALQTEQVTAYEVGARHQQENYTIDVAIFYNNYKDLIGYDEALLFDEQTGYTLLADFDNILQGSSYGFELAANYRVTDNWQLQFAYSWIKLEMQTDATANSFYEPALETRAPRHQLSVRSHWTFAPQWMLDVWWRYVDELPDPNISDDDTYYVGDYNDLDIRLAWSPTDNVELSLVGQNLIETERNEFSGEPLTLYFRNQVERSIYGQIRWTFDF